MTEQFTDSRQCRTANVSQNMGSVPTWITTDDSLLNISAMPKQTALHSKARGHCSLSSHNTFPSDLQETLTRRTERWSREFECVHVRVCQGGRFPFWQMPSVVPSRVSVVFHYTPYLSPVTKIVTVTHKILHNSNLTQIRTEWTRLSSQR